MNTNLSKNSAVFLALVLVTGTISTMIPTTTFAQSYEDSYGKDKKSTSVNKQNVNCNNIIINGGDSTGQGSGGGDMINPMANEGDNDGTGQWLENGNDKKSNGINENIVNFCKNKHNKIVVAAEDQTGSLTVKKEIFGCNEISTGLNEMDCTTLGPESDEWLSCDDPNNAISETRFCTDLQKGFFDIEVTDGQGNLVQGFKGSKDGTTLPDLVPGTYTVNEIVYPDGINRLFQNGATPDCTDPEGFVSGGGLLDNPLTYFYSQICFEFEDEQGIDCSTTTIAAGETKTCIVKNYILQVQLFPI